MATEKQIEFIKRLAAERPSFDFTDANVFEHHLDRLSNREASDLIGKLLQVPKPVQQVASDGIPLADISKGSYWTFDGNVARVRASRSSGRFYAEQLDAESNKFVFKKGLIFRLKSRMTLDEAKAWGAQHGICCVCAAFLSDHKSVEAGIGPVCAKKGWGI